MLLPFARTYGTLFLLLGMLLTSTPSFSQHNQEPAGRAENHRQEKKKKAAGTSRQKLFTGGDMSAWFGNVTYVNASPILGYWLTEKELAAGVGATYQYYDNKDINFSTSIYGGSAFLRYYLGETIFAHGQYEVLNVEAYDQFHDRVNIAALLVGGGYSQPMGERSSFVLMCLWNFSESRYSPYSNPVIRAGFNIGF